ncbi:MAG: DUF4382 domain-containing protein, partial [Deltaproteobacteria bacterium]|nr:DUF4382 domain-containing protein [Deltaproteobacteria bacterium]
MMLNIIKYGNIALCCLALLWIGASCVPPSDSTGTGTLIMNITDAPDDAARLSLKKDKEAAEYEQVHITFTEISVHKADADNNTDIIIDGEDNETDNTTEAARIQIMAEDN